MSPSAVTQDKLRRRGSALPQRTASSACLGTRLVILSPSAALRTSSAKNLAKLNWASGSARCFPGLSMTTWRTVARACPESFGFYSGYTPSTGLSSSTAYCISGLSHSYCHSESFGRAQDKSREESGPAQPGLGSARCFAGLSMTTWRTLACGCPESFGF